MEMNEEEILRKYKLSDEEHEQYYQTIKRIYTSGKTPVKRPICVIIGGQTGAGKSGIIGYSNKMFSDDNVIIINSDEIKPFHPKSEEIARLYPSLYTKITDQESNTWTSKVFEDARREGYNIIFEGTMKNNRIADESITELEDLGYTVIVRGLAVCDLESRMSILERYEGQVATKGWGRLVVPEHHNQTYEGMPNTIEYIERTGKYDILEIYARGEIPSEPINIYSVHNPNSASKTEEAIKGKSHLSKFPRKYGYSSAKESILGARQEEISMTSKTLEERIRRVLDSMAERGASDVEMKMVLDLMNYYQSQKKTRIEPGKNGQNEGR